MTGKAESNVTQRASRRTLGNQSPLERRVTRGESAGSRQVPRLVLPVAGLRWVSSAVAADVSLEYAVGHESTVMSGS
jgi:hypothetical protein